ncbi:MAG TPA: hypothetical protein VHV51_11850 [Polyangiaceae bacterium]|jgi:predicted esterase|nr:hypothetical protein [Polyangiaceae bacterium]
MQVRTTWLSAAFLLALTRARADDHRVTRDAHAGAAPEARLAPLAGAWLEPLQLPNGKLAYVAPPIGAREPRPLLVAVHGAGDRAEWACGGWRLATNAYAFVVCPQGLKFDSTRFAWDSARTIERSVREALLAVRSRYAEYVAPGPVIYLGFSQGATLAGPTLLAEPQRFSAAALAEGGYALSGDRAFLRQLRDAGTTRVMLVCGTAGCFRNAALDKKNFDRAGIELFISGDAHAGHNLNREMQTALRKSFPAFVSGLPAWRDFSG